jgi:CDP-diacylglycerol--glycerol-3-phosphate 3-phosphatidyltransferase
MVGGSGLLSRTQIPNMLTVGRLVLIPIFVGLLIEADGEASLTAALLFAAAGATDQIDGWLARRWHAQSRFGGLADPLADRLMIDAAVVLLWHYGRVPLLGLVIILGRDLVLLSGYKLVAERGYEFSVNMLGKAATWVLYASIALIIVSDPGTGWPVWLFWAGLGLALAAGVEYVTRAFRTVVAR